MVVNWLMTPCNGFLVVRERMPLDTKRMTLETGQGGLRIGENDT